jgi:hypothetical protein
MGTRIDTLMTSPPVGVNANKHLRFDIAGFAGSILFMIQNDRLPRFISSLTAFHGVCLEYHGVLMAVIIASTRHHGILK